MDKFIFGYLLNEENNEELNYEIQTILKYNDEKERNNDFEKIFNGKKFDDLKNESIIYDNKHKKIGISYLVNDNINPKENEILLGDEGEDYTNLNNYILYCIILYE